MARPRPSRSPRPRPRRPKPAVGPPAATLSEIMMAQTAESLAALSSNLTEAMTRANQVFSTAFLEQAKDAARPGSPIRFGVQGALNEVWSHLAQQPETLREAHAKLWQRYAEIWQKHADLHAHRQGARRRAPARQTLPRSRMALEPRLLDAARDLSRDVRFHHRPRRAKPKASTKPTKRKAAFFIKQAVDAASPSNFLMTNPAALRALLQTHGAEPAQGHGQSRPAI